MPDLSRMSDEELVAYAAQLEAFRSPTSMAKWLKPDYHIRAHHRLIGDTLANLGKPGRKRKLMVLAPPRAGKSELVTKFLPLWWLSHHPTHQVVAAAYGADLAKKWGRDVRALVREHGHKLNMAMSPDARNATAWQLASGGGMRTTSVGAGLTGHDADLLLCDDPHKNREEAESKVFRDKVDNWWTSTFITRQSPGTPVVLILTRWHEDDIAGRLLEREGDEWSVLRLPAICDSKDDPLGRNIGDPLGHPKIPDDPAALNDFWGQMQRNVSKRDWFSMYMCDPQPVEGALLTLEQVEPSRHRPGEPIPYAMRVAVAVDPSGTSGGDEAGIVAGFLGADERVYITHDGTAQYSPTEWAAQTMLLAHELAADVVYIENNFGGEMCKLQLESAWSDLEEDGSIPPDMPIPKIEEVRAKYGKRIRAEPVAQHWVQGNIKLIGEHNELIKQWTSWQPGSRESPGRIDAAVYLAQGLLAGRSRGPSKVIEPPVGQSIYQALADYEQYSMY